MSKNPVLATLLSVLIFAILTVFAVPKMLGVAEDARNLVASQNEPQAPYSGSGVVVDFRSSGNGCSVELIADPGLISVTSDTCSGIQLGDTVKVIANTIR